MFVDYFVKDIVYFPYYTKYQLPYSRVYYFSINQVFLLTR